MWTERRRLPRSLNPIRLWRSSLRLRLTAAGTALAAVTFGVGGLVVLDLYHQNLVDVQTASTLQAARGFGFMAQHGPPPGVPPRSSTIVGRGGAPQIQVLDSQNHVVGAATGSAQTTPMLTLAPGQRQRTLIVTSPPYLPVHRATVAAVSADGPLGPVTVVAAASLDRADEQAWQVANVTARALAASLVIVALASWVIVGRALRRVERLRAQVATITSRGDLGRRVGEARGADELARLGKTLNQMLAALERSDERQRRFVSDAAHELRTPLAGITAALEVARSHPEATDQAALVDELLAAHGRLGRLVNDLLVLATSDARAPVRRAPVDLAGVVTDATRRCTPDGVSIVLRRLEHATVLGDESQLGRVMTNLLDNALRCARSRVEVCLTVRSRHAEVVVADDGPGIPPADRERIWDRFVRLDDDRARPGGGAGLGLSLVRELTVSHGGTAIVTDREEAPGAAFVVRLPLHRSPERGRSPAQRPARHAVEVTPGTHASRPWRPRRPRPRPAGSAPPSG